MNTLRISEKSGNSQLWEHTDIAEHTYPQILQELQQTWTVIILHFPQLRVTANPSLFQAAPGLSPPPAPVKSRVRQLKAP